MSEAITLLPDKLARRKQGIAQQLEQLAYRRLEAIRNIDKIDADIVNWESRYDEVGRAEKDWQSHQAVVEARKGDGVEPPDTET